MKKRRNKWLWLLAGLLLLTLLVVGYHVSIANDIEIQDVMYTKGQDHLYTVWDTYNYWIKAYFKNLLHFQFQSFTVKEFGLNRTLDIARDTGVMTWRSALTLLPGLGVGVVIGCSLGMLVFFLPSALRKAVTGVNDLLFAVPDLLLILLLQGLAIQVDQWMHEPFIGVAEVGKQMIYLLPILTMALPMAAYLFHYTVHACQEILHQEYVRTLKAKGLPFGLVFVKHVMRPAMDTILAVIPKLAAMGASSLVVIERLYNIRGITWYFNGTTMYLPQMSNLLATLLIVLAVYVVALKIVTQLLRLWCNPLLRK